MSGAKITPESPSMKRVISVLEENGPMSKDEISELAHISVKTLRGGYLKTLVDAKLIHVFRYERGQSGLAAPIYRAGPDLRKNKVYPPKRFSAAEKSKRWKKKVGYAEIRKQRRLFASIGSIAIAAGYLFSTNEGNYKT